MSPARPRHGWRLTALALAGAVLALLPAPPRSLGAAPFGRAPRAGLVAAAPTANAFGKSGQVRVSFALPGESVEYPLEVAGDPAELGYQWTRLVDSSVVGPVRPLAAARLVAPDAPGFYRLAVVHGERRQMLDGPTLAVLVPFTRKVGSTLNGYRIGTYLSERLGGDRERPLGFVEVGRAEMDLPLTKHLRLGDFVTHDGQQTWPRYAAVSPRLLDKIELVLAELARWQGDTARARLAVDVTSGFRTPVHNRATRSAARDSRHQYGDAADVAIDADGDGRLTSADGRLVALAVEMVEMKNPELAGGMGLYTSRRYRTPYVHIDARGRKARWRS